MREEAFDAINEQEALKVIENIQGFITHCAFPLLQAYTVPSLDAEVNGADLWPWDAGVNAQSPKHLVLFQFNC